MSYNINYCRNGFYSDEFDLAKMGRVFFLNVFVCFVLAKTKGFNGGKQHYYGKDNGGGSEPCLDFWEDMEMSRDYNDDCSSDQYFDILIDIIDNHAGSKNPFFIHMALKKVHDPFATYSSESDESFDDRIGVCKCMVGVDYQMGRLMDHFQYK